MADASSSFKRKRIARGIFQDEFSIYVRAQAALQRKAKRFPLGTSIGECKRWQADKEALFLKQQPKADARGTLASDVKVYLKQTRYLASYKSQRSELRAWTTLFGHMRRSTILAEHVREAVSRWTEAGKSAKTIRNRVGTLRQLYHLLDTDPDTPGIVPPSPCDRLKLPKPQKKRPAYVSPKVVIAVEKKLRESLPPKFNTTDRNGRLGEISQHWLEQARTLARFMVLAACGMRPAQLKRMEPTQVDLKRRTVTVPGAKDGLPVAFWMNSDILAAWTFFIEVDAWGPFDTRSYGRAIHRAGWPLGVRPYNVRHAVGMDLSETGADLDDIREWMGHTSVETTRAFYVPVLSGRMKKLSESLGGRLGWGKKGPAKGAKKSATRKRSNENAA